MSTMYQTLKPQLDVTSLPEFEGVRQRFVRGFENFVAIKKHQGVQSFLADEITHETLVNNPDFLRAIAHRVSDEAVLEKPYIFLSLAPVAHG